MDATDTVRADAELQARQRKVWLATLALLIAGGGISYLGTRAAWPSAAALAAPEPAAGAAVVLPNVPTDLPPGPHEKLFGTACVLCHSPRLALGQPRLGEKKWGEVVHKMAAVYGAPLAKDDEPRIVEYLLAIQADRGAP
jgi:cytochrome c5